MLDYNAALFENVDEKWQWNRINDLSAACYINYINNRYEYIQPLASDGEFDDTELLK